MPAVPFNVDEFVDGKRETTGELTILAAEGVPVIFSAKPEAIVRPLRRREPSDDENPPPDLQDLEAQIIEKLTKLEKPSKAHRESIKGDHRDSFKDFERKQQRNSQTRESKKSSRDVSDPSRHLLSNF